MAALTAAATSINGGHLLSPPFLPRLNLKPHPFTLPSSSSSYSLFYSLSSSISAAGSSSAVHRLRVSARSGGKNSDDDQIVDFSSVRSDKVRLIDEQQNMVGIVSRSEAIRRAEDSELDLVVVSPDADPPVVRIMNYDKYRYEQQKKKREQQKKSAASRMDLKELKMGYNIDVHDYSVRLKAAQKFLKDGDKVKVIVNLKGRGNVFLEKAIQLIRKFQTDLGELATEENNNFARRKREEITERFIYMIIVPNKNVLQKTQETPKKKSSTAPNEVSATV
ncbi:hypothetical protein RND81_08G037300 [Saponaria officinalis]|uniref:Translation initiation factor IF-3 n=1 Tax=Saponaria officinalis TaxID=3572 RepID=A0AAW1J2A1_SAPOF